MASVHVSWLELDTNATPCDVKVSWVCMDTAASSSASKSGVSRLWLIEYYTKEFAKKAPIAVPEEIVGVAAKRNALNRAKAVRAKQIEALAAKAESDLEVLAQSVKNIDAAQKFTYNLIQQAQQQPEPEVDFMRVADSYRKRMKQEDDDLMLFAMVL